MRELRRVSGFIFGRSPRPDDTESAVAPAPVQDAPTPASQSSSRFGALQNNVRSMVNGSSIYSDSPAPSNNNTPKIPFLGFLGRRPQSPPDPLVLPDREPPRLSNDTRSPLLPQHTAGSYMRAIAPPQDPPEPVAIYNPQRISHHEHRHPADVQLGHPGSVDPETEFLQEEIHNHHHRRRRHRRRHHHRRPKPNNPRPRHWIRRRDQRGACFGYITTQAARSKAAACMLSGVFLLTVLAIYLGLALTNIGLGQEIHVLFIMVILATTIYFCHCLIRLCMLMLRPPQETPRIPDMTGPDGFQPIRPIRVHLARDEEYGDAEALNPSSNEDHNIDSDSDRERDNDLEKEKPIQPPPPAYGLWRSSVRVNPDLLHWQKVEANDGGNHASRHFSHLPAPHSRNGSLTDPTAANAANAANAATASEQQSQQGQEQQGPRPPSYASEDGISYVLEAAPRSTAPSHSGVSDIHPAWRPGYAMSEVHLNEWPAPRRV